MKIKDKLFDTKQPSHKSEGSNNIHNNGINVIKSEQRTSVGVKEHQTWKLFLKIIVIIVVYEALIMVLFTLFSISGEWKIFLDPLLLALVIIPVMYRIIIKPLQNTLNERTHIETTLRESEQKLKVILENADAFIYMVSPDYRFEFLNSKWIEKIGYDPIEKNQFCYESIAGLDYPCPDCSNARVFTGENVNFEKTLTNGTTLDVYNTPLYHSDGSVSKLSIAHDVTKHKQMQETLREKEKFLKDIFEAITHPIYVINPDYSLAVYNEVAKQCYDYTDVEMHAMTCYAMTHHASEPCHDQDHPCPIEIIKKTQQPAHVEHIHYGHNGEPKRFDVYAYPVFDENHNIKQVIEYSLDITERKNIEEKLQNSEKRFRELAELLPQIILETDRQGNITFANRHTFEISGYTPQDLDDHNLNILQIVIPEDRVMASANLAKLLAGEQLRGTEYTAIKKDGRTLPVIAYGTPIISQDEVTGTRVIIVDITDLKQMEAQLRQSQKLESIGQLAGGIAHDFNNILTAINGFAELSLMYLDPEKDQRVVNNIQQIMKSGQKAVEIVRQLLTFSRKQMIQLQVLDVNSAIFDLHKMLQRIIGEGIQIQLILHDEVTAIKADPTQLEQVIINLLVNARDAINQKIDYDAEKKIIIETKVVVLDEKYVSSHIGSSVGAHILISISDNGIGIDEATLTRIFEPFFTTKAVGKGTGLGLATVYGIIKQNNGSIAIESEVGKGTTFNIYWPALESEVNPEEKVMQSSLNNPS